MATIAERFCEADECTPAEFRSRLFWRSLYPHAVLGAFLLGGLRSRYFTPERELLDGLGYARNARQVSEEIRDYFAHPWNRGWWRHVGRIRISTSRLRRLIADYQGED